MKQIFILFLLWFGLSLLAQDQISLLFVGDLMQHQAQIDAARQGDGYNYNDCFRHVKKEISAADMAIGNLEVTLGGKPYRGYPAFRMPIPTTSTRILFICFFLPLFGRINL